MSTQFHAHQMGSLCTVLDHKVLRLVHMERQQLLQRQLFLTQRLVSRSLLPLASEGCGKVMFSVVFVCSLGFLPGCTGNLSHDARGQISLLLGRTGSIPSWSHGPTTPAQKHHWIGTGCTRFVFGWKWLQNYSVAVILVTMHCIKKVALSHEGS